MEAKTILHTQRLVLREFTLDDAPFLLELLNTPGWLQYIGDRGVRTITDAEHFIADKFIHSYTNTQLGFYLVALQENNTPIGLCGLIKRDSLPDIDLGYALLPPYEGKGYAHEIAAATVAYAKNSLDLRQLLAITQADNAASIRLLEKLGFQYDKMVQQAEESLMLFVKKPLE